VVVQRRHQAAFVLRRVPGRVVDPFSCARGHLAAGVVEQSVAGADVPLLDQRGVKVRRRLPVEQREALVSCTENSATGVVSLSCAVATVVRTDSESEFSERDKRIVSRLRCRADRYA